MLYLDANVFVYAALNREEIGERARGLLRDVQAGKLQAASSALTFDELVWAIKRHRGLREAIDAGDAFLHMPGLRIVAVDGDLISAALGLIRRYELDPRDSIHAASALSQNAEAMVSDDTHFDKMQGIKRKSI